MLLAKLFYSHNPDLVVLSFMLAVLASFVSLELAGRIKAASGRERFAWLAAAGIAMGGGVWSMHFVAMIALELPFAVAYDLQLTVLSLLMAVSRHYGRSLYGVLASEKRPGGSSSAARSWVAGSRPCIISAWRRSSCRRWRITILRWSPFPC